MKATWLILLLLLQAGLSANAQPYQSIFGNNATEWVYTSSNLWGIVNDTIYIGNDTVINTKTYKIIKSKGNLFPFFAVREDLDNGKFWHLKENSCEDLQFDFSLQEGDTFLHTYQGPGYPDSCGIVDSIRYINGLKYIYFKCGLSYANNEPITFIEGIGSNMNIVVNMCNMGTISKSYLLCSYKDGVKTAYENRKFNGACWMYSNSEKLDELGNDISLYPQPAFTEINISNNTNYKITKAIIISSAGVSIKMHSSPSSITHINIEDVPSGYYFVKLFTDGGSVFTKALVVR